MTKNTPSKKTKRASEETLGLLHTRLAEVMLAKLESGEASASDIGNVIKFLQNNSITADFDNEENTAAAILRNLALPKFDENGDFVQ